jgi:hypothetical protein
MKKKMKAKIYENKVKVDCIEFETIDEFKEKYKKKWG